MNGITSALIIARRYHFKVAETNGKTYIHVHRMETPESMYENVIMIIQ